MPENVERDVLLMGIWLDKKITDNVSVLHVPLFKKKKWIIKVKFPMHIEKMKLFLDVRTTGKTIP